MADGSVYRDCGFVKYRDAVTHHDSVYYTKPLVVTYEFVRVDTQIMEWGCTIEDASYDKRLDVAKSK